MAGLHRVVVIQGPCCPLAWPGTPSHSLRQCQYALHPLTPVSHMSCVGTSRVCCDLCCGLCHGQMDDVSSWAPGTVSFPWAGRRCLHRPGGKGGAWCCIGRVQEHTHSPVLSPPDTLSPVCFLHCRRPSSYLTKWHPGLTEVPEGRTPNPRPLPRAESDASLSHLRVCGRGGGPKGPAAPLSMEGSSRIRDEVTDTVTRILGSSQDEMMMLASGSEETSYLSSVTICEVQTQHKATSLQLRDRSKQQGRVKLQAPCQASGASMELRHSPASQEYTHIEMPIEALAE